MRDFQIESVKKKRERERESFRNREKSIQNGRKNLDIDEKKKRLFKWNHYRENHMNQVKKKGKKSQFSKMFRGVNSLMSKRRFY